MRLFIAGSFTNGTYLGGVWDRCTDHQRQIVRDARNYLESYHYFTDKMVDRIRQEGIKIFLDSGAFSAFTQGVEIDLPKYCDFIRRNADIIEVASVLDAVGDPLKTWQNQQLMESMGAAALPCFHYGEDERYLEWYVERYEYITLGGMVPISNRDLLVWLDRLWDKYLTDENGVPRCRVHGFGMTSVSLMERYPWYSVDSSSWVQIAARGGILHPDFGVIAVSKESPARKDEGRHVTTLSLMEQSQLAHEVAKVGYSLHELQHNHRARWTFCIWAFTELNRRINSHGQTFKTQQPELF